MKRKSSAEKNRHVVAWMNKAEWDQVREYLYSTDTSLQKYALHRISAWISRSGHSTPVAVSCTADLVRCQVHDQCAQLEGNAVVMLYGMALVRFVNLITEKQQGRVAKPLHRLAANLKIPEWIVNLRNDATHRNMPSLKWCRKACREVLEWLQQNYWSRQLSGGDWETQSDDEEDDGKDEVTRQREMETYKKVRELLISYENEQYQVFESGAEGMEKWPAPFAEMSWIFAEIKQFSLDSCDLLVDVLLEDGFLVPTAEQLDTLGCASFPAADSKPQLPQSFLRFWLPLLRTLNSQSFIHLLLQKLFAELKPLSAEPNRHREFYVSAWISELILCNGKKSDFHFETKGQRKARLRDRVFANRVQLRWQQLLASCMDSPCSSTPHLLQLILNDMEHPLPLETQDNLLSLSSIYTQRQSSSPAVRRDQPVYTLESLHEKLRRSRHRRCKDADRGSSSREISDTDADKVRLLRGSPWQLCTENIAWKNLPLGKVPGQSDEPNGLMLESFTTMVVPDQTVENETPNLSLNPTRASSKSEGQIWSHSDVARLKSGIKLF